MSFGLYLHYPFCRNHCHYCDFYKETHADEPERQFFQALSVETALAALKFGLRKREVSSIFIGGGTPSLAGMDYLRAWVEQIHHLFSIDQGVEFSIESNPESVTLEKLEAWREIGITRPVFGVQSFDVKTLKRLGRRHQPEDSQRAVYYTNALGYKTFGVDLVFGLPFQTSAKLRADLDHLLSLDPPHISFYQLTVEPGTRLASEVKSGKVRLPDQETSLALYRGGTEKFRSAGYERYEVSSFAKPGHECLHNMGYWTGRDYLGLGPAAHSFLGGERYMNPRDLAGWLSALRERRLPAERDASGEGRRVVEAIMLGLRTAQGIDRRAFTQRFGQPVDEHLNSSQYRIFIESEHLLEEDDHLRLSDSGLYLADEITRRLIKTA